MKTIKVCDVSKNYRDVRALDHVNLELKGGTIYGLLGRNGKQVNPAQDHRGEINPSSGRILYDDGTVLDDVMSRDLYFSNRKRPCRR